jgi:hypothetical protein
MNRYMILLGGRQALHKMGDIGRNEDDIIRVFSEDEKYYIGYFAEGFGFIDVKFKKEDCRNLSKDEVDELNGKWYGINNQPYYQVSIDYDGNVISNKSSH